jgi:hypothetical protein
MAIAVDASSPVRWSGANTANGSTFVSASFTPPNGSFIVIMITNDTTTGESGAAYTLTGGSLTYTNRVERQGTETTTGGYSGIYTAPVVTGSAMTITLTRTAGTASTGRASLWARVLTGVDGTTPVDTVGASNEGGSTSTTLTTTSITPGANGMLFVADTDWNTKGVMTSSDLTIDTANYATAISVASGYKTCTSGVGVTGSLTAGAAGPQHKWTQIIVREAAGGGGGGITYPQLEGNIRGLNRGLAYRREESGLYLPDRTLVLPPPRGWPTRRAA